MELFPLAARWIHLLAATAWAGLLFFFVLVQHPALAAARADGTAAGITRHIAPRALWLFRWAAVLTWLAGAALLGKGLLPALQLAPGSILIGVGVWLGTVLLASVWLIVWPAQRIALGLVPADEARRGQARRVAWIAARVNFVLVLAVFGFMAAAAHHG